MKGLNMRVENQETESNQIEVLSDRFSRMARDGRTVEAVCVEGELICRFGIWPNGSFLN